MNAKDRGFYFPNPPYEGERFHQGESHFRTQHQADIQSTIAQLRVGSLAETSFYEDWVARGKLLGIPENPHSAIPRGRIRALAFCGASSVAIEEFLRIGDRFNALRSGKRYEVVLLG